MKCFIVINSKIRGYAGSALSDTASSKIKRGSDHGDGPSRVLSGAGRFADTDGIARSPTIPTFPDARTGQKNVQTLLISSRISRTRTPVDDPDESPLPTNHETLTQRIKEPNRHSLHFLLRVSAQWLQRPPKAG